MLTAGGTREPIDDVRHVSNVASGALPAAMAEALLARGAQVHYIHGPGAVLPARLQLALRLDGAGDLDAAAIGDLLRSFHDRALAAQAAWCAGQLRCHPVQSAADAARVTAAVVARVKPHLVACAMAVSDFSPRAMAGKLSSEEQAQVGLTVHMAPTAKVIDTVLAACPSAALLGFKLLSGASDAEHAAAARVLAQRSGARWVFSNDMKDYRAGLRRGTLWSPLGEALDRLPGGEGDAGRIALAEAIVVKVLGYLEAAGRGAGAG